MNLLKRKDFKASRGLTYAYYCRKNEAQLFRPTIVFLHGFPDCSSLWLGIIERIAYLDYGILSVDILGMGETDKPTLLELYNMKDCAADLNELLDHEKINEVIVTGHDAGSALAQRFYLFEPEKVVGMILLNVGYKLPSYQPFNLAAVNALMLKMFGYEAWAYWEFTSSQEATKLIEDNPDRFYEILHGDAEGWMKRIFGTRGAMKDYLEGKINRVPVKEYAREGQNEWCAHVRRHGIDAPLCWYRATVQNIQSAKEKEIPPSRLTMNFPVMFVACMGDAACRAEMIKPAETAGHLPDLEINWLDCGHWSPLERPGEIAGMMISFLSRHFGST